LGGIANARKICFLPAEEKTFFLQEKRPKTTNNEGGRMMPKKTSKETKTKTKSVRFDLFAPEAQAVSLAGDFNAWDASRLPMKKDKHGTWKAIVSLEPGRYEYRFWVDGAWCDDPLAQERVSNPFGSNNSIKIVG
jgi:1,4-alpha-glucan branching enzyme